MNYRLATVLAREAHAANTTKVIDLNLADPVSQFVVLYEPLNGATGAPAGHPAKCISKIELVDGSDVLFSLTGQEAQAADWYHREKEPPNMILYLDANPSYMVFNLNFGRHLWDPLYAFDPKKFNNPQLKITIDIDAGGIATASGYLTVLAMIFDQKVVAPVGFLMHKEIKDYALAVSSHEYTDLPTDYLYRKLFMRIQKYGTTPEDCFSTIKLSEDNDRKVPFYNTIFEILKTIMAQTRPYRESVIGNGAAAAQYFYCTATNRLTFGASQWRATIGGGELAFYDGDGGRFIEIQTGAGPNFQVLLEGHCPHGVIEIPFGLQDDPTDWYDPTKLGSLRLDILSSATMAATDYCQIFLQQLRTY